MLFYLSSSDNPYFNLALEEYFLTHFKEELLLCYVNRPSLVVGRFQVPYREIDAAFLHQQGMDLVRRLSGGGSVYHDFGNLNYSYISSCQDGEAASYDAFNARTVHVLSQLGLEDLTFERNNIFCGAKKISGVAQYKRRQRMVHHGTLLVEADLEALRRLFVKKDYYHTKAIPSVSSSVANVSTFVQVSMNEVISVFQGLCDADFSPHLDMPYILSKAKDYSAVNWVVGKAPVYRIEKEGLHLQVEKGKITQAEPHSDLRGLYHSYTELSPQIEHADLLF